jgi:hypothetical protein
MDEINPQRPVPGWFTAAAIAILLGELLGAAMFVSQLQINPALVDAADRAVLAAAPQWMIAAYGVAVAAGVVGAILLLLRRRQAEPLLMVSLMAVVVQDSAYLLAPALRNLTASDDLFLPFVILVVCYAIWHFARSARASGWLR